MSDQVAEPEDDDGLEEEGDPDQEELEARTERGEVCADCGDEFTESNGVEALCEDCFEAAEDRGETSHAPKSKFPLRP